MLTAKVVLSCLSLAKALPLSLQPWMRYPRAVLNRLHQSPSVPTGLPSYLMESQGIAAPSILMISLVQVSKRGPRPSTSQDVYQRQLSPVAGPSHRPDSPLKILNSQNFSKFMIFL